MNPIYTIRESPYRWWILAGIAFLAGTVGAMAMLAYGWPHPLARVWLLAGLAATAVCLVMRFVEWKRTTEEMFAAQEGKTRRPQI